MNSNLLSGERESLNAQNAYRRVKLMFNAEEGFDGTFGGNAAVNQIINLGGTRSTQII